jgi:hypothetical protein
MLTRTQTPTTRLKVFEEIGTVDDAEMPLDESQAAFLFCPIGNPIAWPLVESNINR